MQSVGFAEGETLTYLRGERDWIAVSGSKGDRIFYRKAIIACGGKVWHHIAFEYPIALKREMDTYVTRQPLSLIKQKTMVARPLVVGRSKPLTMQRPPIASAGL